MTDLEGCLEETQDELEGYYCWIDELDQCVYAVQASTRGYRNCRSTYPSKWSVEIEDVQVRWPIGPGPDLISYDNTQMFEDKIQDICEASCW